MRASSRDVGNDTTIVIVYGVDREQEQGGADRGGALDEGLRYVRWGGMIWLNNREVNAMEGEGSLMMPVRRRRSWYSIVQYNTVQ